MSSEQFVFVGNTHEKIDGYYSSNIVCISDNEFVIAPENDLEYVNNYGVFIYSKKKNEWKLFVTYPIRFVSTKHSICYNNYTKILYLYGDESKMVNINMETKEFKIVKSKAKYVGEHPQMLCIDNQCHVILGSDSKEYLIWNDSKCEFETVFEFPNLNKGLHGHGAVYARRRRNVYIFGGYDYGSNRYNRKIWKCELDNDKKISELNCEFQLRVYYTAYVLTADENYIIYFHSSTGILVLDLNEEKIFECSIEKGIDASKAILYNDGVNKVLLFGYIRYISNMFGILIPNQLIGIFEKYCATEKVFLIDSDGDCYNVDLNDVFNDEKVRRFV
eukprot:146618_1